MEEIKNLIESLSQDSFKKLVKNFYKQKYETKEVSICDGPYDGGIDIIIIKEGNEIKRNIQITVQKTQLEEKIESDLIKAKNNVDEFNYLNKLDFFVSTKMTKSKKNKLEKNAEVKYDITLKIFDAEYLSEIEVEYPIIRDTIYGIYNFPNKDGFIKIDKRKKILYDLLSEGKDMRDIKEQFVFSYILLDLFTFPNSKINDLSNRLEDVFSKSYDEKFYRDKLSKLIARHEVIKNKDDQTYILNECTKKRIDNILNQSLAFEKLLKEEIELFLHENSIKVSADEIVKLILDVYKANYEIDIDEINKMDDNYANSIRKIYSNIIKYFKEKSFDLNSSKYLANKLLKICESSDYLNKISISLLFTNLYQSEGLDKYINQKVQKLILDTQILLRLLCVYYREVEVEDYAYSSVLELKKIKEENKRITFYTTNDYIIEVTNHILEAYKLNRFLDLPYLEKLGPSKNVFFNHYINLKKKNYITIDFIDFLDEITSCKSYVQTKLNNSELYNYLIELFENLGLNLIDHERYNNFSEIKIEYEKELSHLDKLRPKYVIENDLRTILYLSCSNIHTDENGYLNEPYLITWDTVFYSFRKNLLTNYEDYGFWYIYSPYKFIDRFSVSKFKLNPKSINFNIISIVETNYNMTSKASLLDVMSSLFNKESLTDLKLAQKLIDLKEKAKPYDEVYEYEGIEERYSPLTDILIVLRNHYCTKESKYKLDDLTNIFQDSNYEDRIIKILETFIAYYAKEKILNLFDFTDFDNLIEEKKNNTKSLDL